METAGESWPVSRFLRSFYKLFTGEHGLQTVKEAAIVNTLYTGIVHALFC
jgi:hypothetical protein